MSHGHRRVQDLERDRHYRIAALHDADRRRLEAALRAFERNQPCGVLASQPPEADYLRRCAVAAGLIGSLVLLLILATGYGVPGAEQVILDRQYRALEISLALLAWGTLVQLPLRWSRLHTLPRGLFLFPGHLVEVRRQCLVVRSVLPVDSLKAIARGDGTDAAVQLDTFAAGAPTRSLVLASRTQAEHVLSRLTHFRQLIAGRQHVWVMSESDAAVPLDPVANMSTPEFSQRSLELPGRVRDAAPHAAVMVVAVLVGALVAPPLRAVRNHGSEQAQWAAAQRAGSRDALLSYLVHGVDHRVEARAQIRHMDVEAAMRSPSILPLRALLSRYPTSGLEGVVGAEIDRRYRLAAERFDELTAARRPEVLAFMHGALRHAKASGEPIIDVLYRRPPAVGGPQGFRPEYAAWNERRVVTGLQDAFEAVFTLGQLRLHPVEHVTLDRPTMTIAYTAQVVPLSFSGLPSLPRYPAVRLTFVVRFSGAGALPPAEMRIETDPATSSPIMGTADLAAEVYRSMTNDDFALLEKQMREALF